MSALRGAPQPKVGERGSTDRLEDDFELRISAFSVAAHSAGVSARPPAVHELASAVEGLIGFVTVWSELIPGARQPDLVPELRALLRRARRARDLHARTALLDRHLAGAPPAARTAVRPVREALSRRLEKSLARLRALITPTRIETAIAQLRSALPGIHAALPLRLRAFERLHRNERRRRERALVALRLATGRDQPEPLAGSRRRLRRWRRLVSCLHTAGAGTRPESELLGELESTLDSLRCRARLRRLLVKRLRSAAARNAMALPALEIAAEHAALLERARRLAIALLGSEPHAGAALFQAVDGGDDSVGQ